MAERDRLMCVSGGRLTCRDNKSCQPVRNKTIYMFMEMLKKQNNKTNKQIETWGAYDGRH